MTGARSYESDAEHPDLVVDRLVRRYMSETGERDYRVAFDQVKRDPVNSEAIEL